MKSLILKALTLCVFATPFVEASEAIQEGEITNIHYRNEYLNFKIQHNDSNGNVINSCETCGPDISGHANGGFCYIDKADQNLITLFLSSYMNDKPVSARVESWSNCKVYDFRIDK
ncbi:MULTISPECIES: hypothetical protein [unclassified Agarivorans]|uniref:hypothetical protein n=1 Tax=unclassified Agarivorans TaxID=2636026 RepID=UPI0026E27C67|nr:MULTISPECIES: hypothetical protein [unclassified Agarivorans]MDO6685563.1 hypothetical protein [Agarivorans sp. 3_MG-2023]MDO6715949.1 hypothetical protein [Agarivorans sp. 2_MG-2023]